MQRLKSFLKRIPFLLWGLAFTHRIRMALQYLGSVVGALWTWLIRSRETTNFTYDLTDINQRYLISLVADVTGNSYQQIAEYVAEIESDISLRDHIRAVTASNDQRITADLDVRFGRRVAWYAFVRALKPKVVVETGVDKGLGSCVLASALMKNEQEGYPGSYFGTDINPRAGYLLCGKYRQYGEILYGDSITSLSKFNQTIDLFINDSDHSPGYEQREYETIARILSPESILLGDNSGITDKLLDFALSTGRHYIFFQEEPKGHWYPGSGIGIAFRRK